MKNYFTQKDFDQATPPCNMDDMHQLTMIKFNRARDIAGIPFVVNSAARTREHELKQGRPATSSHIVTRDNKARAMDIKATDGRSRFKIIDALLKAGFTRIGIANTFIHADDDPTKDQNVVWFY